jgi:chromosome segregation ATPase
MSDDIKLLEELVVEAVDRLRGLTREREELRQEVETMNERLDALKRKAADVGRGSDAAQAWQTRQAQSLTVLREALSELRGDRDTA